MVIVVTGPTGAGKSELGIFLARKLNGEIINADSTQIFEGMPIATNKIKDKCEVPHHLLSEKKLTDEYTVYDYQKDCRRIIKEIEKRGKIPILVGGTGLYINAALYDYKFDKIKKQNYEKYNDKELYELLLKVDPNTKIHKNNRKRIENALTYYKTNGKPFSEKDKTEKLLYNAIFIGLTTDREELYKKINNRVDTMVEEGLIEEAKDLYDQNIKTKAVMTPIGPKELFKYFEGKITQKEAIDSIKTKSRKYAKRQYTWFKNKMNLKWFEVNFKDFDKTKQQVIEYIENFKK